MRRFTRGMPVRCTTPHGPLYAVVYDRQLPLERERGLVYLRIAVDHPAGPRGHRLHVAVGKVSRRTPGAHALRGSARPVRRGFTIPWGSASSALS